jgi:hypothetical protein
MAKTRAEELQKRPDGPLLDVIAEVTEFVQQVGSPEYPYAYRYYDTGDDDVMLEVRCLKYKKKNAFELHIVDKTGKRLPVGDPLAASN